MASYYRDLCAYLREHGCSPRRQGKGSHEIWFSPITGRNFTIPHDCKNRITVRAICKQAGVTLPTWL